MKGPWRRVAGALLVLAGPAAAGCGEEEAPEPSGPDFGELEADQVMVEVEHYMTREGVRRAHLTADTVYMLDEGSTARLRHFTVDFFGEEGEQTSVLRAVDGRYDMRQGNMRARQDVRVVDADESQRLRTEELVYESSTGRLRSDDDFVLLRGRDTIRGTGFVTDPGLDSLRTRRPSMVSPPASGAETRAGGTATDTADGSGRAPGGDPSETAEPAPAESDTLPSEVDTLPAEADTLPADSAGAGSPQVRAGRKPGGAGPP